MFDSISRFLKKRKLRKFYYRNDKALKTFFIMKYKDENSTLIVPLTHMFSNIGLFTHHGYDTIKVLYRFLGCTEPLYFCKDNDTPCIIFESKIFDTESDAANKLAEIIGYLGTAYPRYKYKDHGLVKVNNATINNFTSYIDLFKHVTTTVSFMDKITCIKPLDIGFNVTVNKMATDEEVAGYIEALIRNYYPEMLP